MAAKHADEGAGVATPQARRPVVRCRNDAPALQAERKAIDRSFMAAEDGNLFSGCSVPETRSAIARCRPYEGAIGTERDILDALAVTP